MRASTDRASRLHRSLRWLRRPGGRLVRLAAFSLFLALGLIFVLSFQFLPSRYKLNEGDVSPYTIKAPQKVSYISQIKTREERTRAAEAVNDVYVLDAGIVETQRQRLNDSVREIDELRRSSAPLDERRDGVRRVTDPKLSVQRIDEMLSLDELEWRGVTADAARVLDLALRNRITERQLDQVQASLPALVNPGLSERQANHVLILVRSHVKANYLLDAEATAKAKRDAQDRVQPVRLTVEKGESVIRDGDIVRDVDLERLEAIGLRNPEVPWKAFVATTLLVGVFVVAAAVYIHNFQPGVVDHQRRLLLLALVIILAVLSAKLTIPGRELYGYLFPSAAAAMLIAVLLGGQIAFISTVVMAIAIGMATGTSFEMLALTFVTGIVGALAVAKAERLNAFVAAGIYVAGASFTVVTAFHLFAGELDLQRLAMLGVMSAINGALSAVLTLGMMSVLGHLFGVTTTLALLDMAHPTQPVFRRLLTEAPGTYHHSLIVANLCERAAEVVGADPLLSRVGAYYHDIGKTIRPYAFIENQVAGDNIHDRLDPITSAQIIAAHVSEGLDLGRKHGLPPAILDLIAQHHGTRLISFFYHRAREADPDVSAQQFRYPGPVPQTREAAIMMLADSVEAAVRSCPDHSKEKTNGIIQKVFSDCIAEGQLDQCDLTLRDIQRVRQVFASVLQGIFHPRIQYPESSTPQPREILPVADVRS